MCPAPSCPEVVADEYLACPAHWYLLPRQLRHRVWTAWRIHGPGSWEHSDAVAAAIDYWTQDTPGGDAA